MFLRVRISIFVCVCVFVCLFRCLFVCVCLCVCVRACVRVSNVLLSLCSIVVAPVLRCWFSFFLPCFFFSLFTLASFLFL